MEKSKISFLFLFLMLSAFACKPSPGYDFCYYQENDNSMFIDGLKATSRIELSNIQDAKGNTLPLFISQPFIKYKCVGDVAFAFKGLDEWKDIYYDESFNSLSCHGCSDIDVLPLSEGVYSGFESGDSLVFSCFTRTVTGGYWISSWASYGWLSPVNFEVGECVHSSDCPQEEYSQQCFQGNCVLRADWVGDTFCGEDPTKIYQNYVSTVIVGVPQLEEREKATCENGKICENGQCVWKTGSVGGAFCSGKNVQIQNRNDEGILSNITVDKCNFLEECYDAECVPNFSLFAVALLIMGGLIVVKKKKR